MSRRTAFVFIIFIIFSAGLLWAQNTTLVYAPDIQLGAGGPIRFLEEREDGDLTRKAVLKNPGEYVEFVQKRRSDGGLHRLEWFYDGSPEAGNFRIEEQDSQPDGTWSATGILQYRGGVLTKASFYSGESLVEEREYDYDSDGKVTKEHTTRAGDEYPYRLVFERPVENTVEALSREPDGTEMLIARLQYDSDGRLTVEERFIKGKFNRRDEYSYNSFGKLSRHVRYDNRELPVRTVTYGYSADGLPQSVVHRDVKDRVLFGLSYFRESSGEVTTTTIKNNRGEVTGSIEYRRKDGSDVSRKEIFHLGDGKLEIIYSNFDEKGNWLRKELSTYSGRSLKDKAVTTRIIRYFDQE